jgi:transposase
VVNAEVESMVSQAVGTDQGANNGADMSARSQRIEVITRCERRRRWSAEEKRAIVEESLAPNASIMAVARKHGIGTGQLYSWRHQLLGRRSSGSAGFARVEVVDERYRLSGPAAGPSSGRPGVIEIMLPSGPTVRVDAQVDEHVLRRVLGVLCE